MLVEPIYFQWLFRPTLIWILSGLDTNRQTFVQSPHQVKNLPWHDHSWCVSNIHDKLREISLIANDSFVPWYCCFTCGGKRAAHFQHMHSTARISRVKFLQTKWSDCARNQISNVWAAIFIQPSSRYQSITIFQYYWLKKTLVSGKHTSHSNCAIIRSLVTED